MSAIRNVTIIDSRVGDVAAVIASLPAGETVFVLDGSSDGLSQISALLAGIENIGALHIVAHGSAGALYLGRGVVDAAALAAHANDLAAIGRHLASSGDILLYGCDVAAGTVGAAFISAFGALTGADVAASTDVTGAAALGGNWTLEASIGAIEARAHDLAGFLGTLDVIDGDGAANVLVGTANDDVISGFGGNDTISGLGGNDEIDGGTGADAMTGGLGDDTYFVDNSGDTVNELGNEGTDLVFSAGSLALSLNVENLTLLGSSPFSAIGNLLNNTLTGNTGANLLNGGLGNDFLDGKNGTDTMIGGKGDDTYVLNVAADIVVENEFEGNDTARTTFSYALDKNFENLVLLGTGDFSGVGNVLSNVITGNDGVNILSGEDGNDVLVGGGDSDTLIGGTGNDTLDGGTGVDAMIGGSGNDTFILDQIGDIIVEEGNQGNDTIVAGFDYVLGDDFENITLSGTGSNNATGSSADNLLTGNAGTNILLGLAGNDALDGGAGSDTLIGGIGDDKYTIDTAGDLILEDDGEGTDTVFANTSYTLVDNTENLTLGTVSTNVSNLNGTGNAVANVILGNDGANILTGLAGSDSLDGGKGADTLIGGEGDDDYIVDNASDSITETTGVGTGVDTVHASLSWTLAANVENLVLTDKTPIDGTGNELANSITGNEGDNVIDGKAGADVMTGGAGADTYYADSTADVVIETLRGGGTDTVIASASFTLMDSVDDLRLTGSADLSANGNTLANSVIGNSGRNVINGGGGKDSLDGGESGDLYVITGARDQFQGEIQDTGTSGNDSIRVTYSGLGYVTLNERDTGIEMVVAGTGTGAIADTSGTAAISISATKVLNALTITGNAGINRISGTAFGDTIDGGADKDSMSGGGGDDTYFVDNIKDRVSERALGGNDIVYSSASFKLSKAVETLILTGSDNLTGTGNNETNTLNGNSGDNLLDGFKGEDILRGFDGNDTLIGGLGSDTLDGGSGADAFFFKASPKTLDGFDTILDFSRAQGDTIALAKAGFRGLGSVLGTITADQFQSGAGVDTARDATDRILYNTSTGNLWYDADGLGTLGPILIAQLGVGSNPTLSHADIFLVA